MHTFNLTHPFDPKDNRDYSVSSPPKYIELKGYLYLVKSTAFPEVIKIGRTSNFKKRLQQYNSDQPYNTFQPIVISHLFPNVIEAESKIVNYLSVNLIQPTTLKYEWFLIEHESLLIDLIQQAEKYYGEWL